MVQEFSPKKRSGLGTNTPIIRIAIVHLIAAGKEHSQLQYSSGSDTAVIPACVLLQAHSITNFIFHVEQPGIHKKRMFSVN